MTSKKKTLTARLKIPAIAFGILVVLFFLFDKIVMPSYVQQGKTTKVPNVVGHSLDDAIKLLAGQGLVGKKADVRTDKQYPEGTVVVQNPPANAEVKFGRGVYLTVSGGEMLFPVPGLRGRSVRDATFALERNGLVLGTTRYEVSDDFPQGTIIEQDVPEGTKVSSGKTINVVVSQGKSGDRVIVPDVLKKTLTEAEKIITQAGLRLGNVSYQINKDLLPNTVVDQYPRPNELILPGQAVDLFVAKQEEHPGSEN
ncbi:MAG: PASTA domain-containing protein [Ignavibacteriales bacterium]|nr:PASTA domain-containing protein [Ignavibacteriales bacterium]